MRTLYLIRHGEVEFGGEKRCIGHTELELSPRGQRQGQALARFFDGISLSALYASPAGRAVRTARLLSEGRWPVHRHPALLELSMGEWEGKTFREIRRDYPDLYRQRGLSPDRFIPPGGERLQDAQARMAGGLREILTQRDGDIAVVAHAGVNRLLLCLLEGLPLADWLGVPQPYGCLNVIRVERLSAAVVEAGRMPQAAPGREECLGLLRHRETPANATDHCMAVQRKADGLAAALTARGVAVDRELVRAAALLHDIARAHPDHAATGAQWVRAEGYPLVADIIAQHHQLREPGKMDEAAVVYLADKLVQGTQEVSLEQRFAASRRKCRDEAALRAHDQRHRQATAVQALYQSLTGE